MADDTALKERLHNATHAPERAPGVAPIVRRARMLRSRRVAAAVAVTCLLAVAVATPMRALRHIGQATTPAAGTRVSAFGISANVPPGWSARIYAVPGYGGAALYASTAGRLPDGPPLSAWNAGHRGGLAVGVVEVTGLCPCPGFPAADSIAAFAAGDWYQPSDGSTPVSYRVFQTNGGYLRPITIDGRSFLVWATLPSRDAARPSQFQRIGALLDSVRITPEADQPDASTLPVRFDGSSGSTGASTNASGDGMGIVDGVRHRRSDPGGSVGPACAVAEPHPPRPRAGRRRGRCVDPAGQCVRDHGPIVERPAVATTRGRQEDASFRG